MEALHRTMAKRARGSITTRPGQRPPLQRSTARPSGSATRPSATATPAAPLATPPATLTDAEEARAAELEAAIVAEERRAEDAKRRARTRTTDDVAVRSNSSIAIAAANEYAYVARDVRRIVLVGGSLIVLLLAMWVIAHIAHLGPF